MMKTLGGMFGFRAWILDSLVLLAFDGLTMELIAILIDSIQATHTLKLGDSREDKGSNPASNALLLPDS